MSLPANITLRTLAATSHLYPDCRKYEVLAGNSALGLVESRRTETYRKSGRLISGSAGAAKRWEARFPEGYVVGSHYSSRYDAVTALLEASRKNDAMLLDRVTSKLRDMGYLDAGVSISGTLVTITFGRYGRPDTAWPVEYMATLFPAYSFTGATSAAVVA